MLKRKILSCTRVNSIVVANIQLQVTLLADSCVFTYNLLQSGICAFYECILCAKIRDLPEENLQTLSDNQKRTERNFYGQPNAGQRFVQPVQQLEHRLKLPVFRLYYNWKNKMDNEKYTREMKIQQTIFLFSKTKEHFNRT